jgi:acetoin utilization protein AcuB
MNPPARIVADAMTAYPCSVSPEDRLGEAVAIMLQHHVRHLPVVDSASTLVGILSDSDVRTAVGEPSRYLELRGQSAAQLRVRDVMSTTVMSLAFDCPLSYAARMFADMKIGALAVTDKFGALIGILSYVDVLRVLTY